MGWIRGEWPAVEIILFLGSPTAATVMNIPRSFTAPLSLASLGAANFPFHGFSVFIYPSDVSVHSKDSESLGANLCTYIKIQVYFNFGW